MTEGSRGEGPKVRRGGRANVKAAIAAFSLLALALSVRDLSAQVGHDPSASPFIDITTRQSITFNAGWFFGNEAKAGVGAQAAPSYGVKLRSTLSGPMDLIVSGAYVPSQRRTIDATQPESTRVGGPVPLDMVIADISIGLSLTGGKTWHRLAPYLSAGIGLVMPTQTTVDPGGFKAGSGFTFAGAFGIRARVSRSLGMVFEARDNTIRYEWPLSYFSPKDNTGVAITPPILNPVGNKNTQTTHNFTLSAGLSYNFNF